MSKVEQEDVNDAYFMGQRIGNMDRDQLLRVVKHLSDRVQFYEGNDAGAMIAKKRAAEFVSSNAA